MSENSKIEWTDHTFNPWEGCQKVGPGCDHCYAETRNARFAGGTAINWGPGAPRRRTSEANWRKPLTWNANHERFLAEHGRRQRVFCASLADVFDNVVPVAWLADFLDLCRLTPNLDKLLLTKRIGNVKRRLAEAMEYATEVMLNPLLANWIVCWLDGDLPPADIWLGATIVNQEEANRDIPKLLCLPARVRFLSMEPLLGPVDLTHIKIKDAEHPERGQPPVTFNALRGWYGGAGDPARLDWVIAGGESGPGARPMHPEWARSLRDRCAAAGVPFLFKQWGEWLPGHHYTSELAKIDSNPEASRYECAQGGGDGDWEVGYELAVDTWDEHALYRVGKKLAGRLLDGQRHDGFPGAST